MSRQATAAAAGRDGAVVVPVSAVAWTLVTVLFLSLRLGVVWQAPVGGAELAHLSGAWQAHIGVEGARFVPTLFQALSALVFEWTDGEVPQRALALMATASIPAAVFLLRPFLGNAGALLALLLLALDPPAIPFAVTASAMAFDLAIALWILVLALRPATPWWAWAVGGFLAATAGPLPLTLIAALAGLALARRFDVDQRRMVAGAAGALLGVAVASVQFGYGWDGVVVPPFDLVAASFEEDWSTARPWELALLYSGPLVLGGLAATVLEIRGLASRAGGPVARLLLAWVAVSGLWLVTALGSHAVVPLVALTTPLVLILGPWLARAIGAMWQADWSFARFVIPGAAFVSIIAAAVVLDWAWERSVGPAGEVAIVVALLAAAAFGAAALATNPAMAPTLFLPAVLLGAVPLVSGAIGVGLSGSGETIPSPASPYQARVLRDVALQAVERTGGSIVVHERYRDEIVWPLRDSGTIVVSTRVPPDAGVVIWPTDLEAPAALAPLEGDWALERRVAPPTDGFLELVRWFTNRNDVESNRERVDVYTRPEE